MNNNTSVRKQTYSSSTVVIIISLLALVGICIYLYNSYKEFKARLLSANSAANAYTECPDYWDTIGNGKCQNVNSLGSCSKIKGANTMDFSGEVFTNTNTGNYAKCKWAKACNIAWGNIDRMC